MWQRWALVLALGSTMIADRPEQAAEVTRWPLGYYGETTGRTWQRLAVPAAVCGNGTPYAVFVSTGPALIDGQPNRRLAVWLEGGGATQMSPTGQVQTPINSLGDLQNRLNANLTYDGATGIFMDHPANDRYIGEASWAFFPYCTQDVHLGERTDAVHYDMTSQQPLNAQIQALLSGGQTPTQIEAAYPGLDVVATPTGEGYTLQSVYVDIQHRGGLDIAAGWGRVLEFLAQGGYAVPNDVLLGGSSAGGYGVWYNAWRLGDSLYLDGLARMTLSPSAGHPTTRRWDGTDLVIDPPHVLGIQALFAYYHGRPACTISGGGYTAQPGATCDDVLDLITHYTSRWPGTDVEVMPVLNKEDAVVISREFGGLPEPQFTEGVLNFCQSVHRYGQLIFRMPHALPYFAWQYQRSYVLTTWQVDRVHGFNQSLLLEPMLSPAGQSEPALFGLLETLNRLAARVDQFKAGPALIQTVAGLDPNLHDPAAQQVPYQTEPYLPECNVAWPDVAAIYIPAILLSR